MRGHDDRRLHRRVTVSQPRAAARETPPANAATHAASAAAARALRLAAARGCTRPSPPRGLLGPRLLAVAVQTESPRSGRAAVGRGGPRQDRDATRLHLSFTDIGGQGAARSWRRPWTRPAFCIILKHSSSWEKTLGDLFASTSSLSRSPRGPPLQSRGASRSGTTTSPSLPLACCRRAGFRRPEPVPCRGAARARRAG